MQQERFPAGPIEPPPPSPTLDAVVARLGGQASGRPAIPPSMPTAPEAPIPASPLSAAPSPVVRDEVSQWSRLRIQLATRVPVEHLSDTVLRVVLHAHGRSQAVTVRIERSDDGPGWLAVESEFGSVSANHLAAGIRSLGSPKRPVGMARVGDNLVIRWAAFLDGATAESLLHMIDTVGGHADHLESRLTGGGDRF